MTQAEQAATRMEGMLDAIEVKMAQLEQLQLELDKPVAQSEFRKLDGELQQLETEMQQLQTDITDKD